MCEVIAGLFLNDRDKLRRNRKKQLTVSFEVSDGGDQTELCNVDDQIFSFGVGSFFEISDALLNVVGGLVGSADFCLSLK